MTRRLTLEPLDAAHLDALAEMNADKHVMEFVTAPMTRNDTAAFLAHVAAHRWRTAFP